MSNQLSPVHLQEIYHIFTDSPEAGLVYPGHELRRSVDDIEEFRLRREWATHALAEMAVNDVGVVVDTINRISEEKPFHGLWLGINIVRRLQSDNSQKLAEGILDYLDLLMQADASKSEAEQIFSYDDHLWLMELHIENLEPSFRRMPASNKTQAIGGAKNHVPSTENRSKGPFSTLPVSDGDPTRRLGELAKLSRNKANDQKYDEELMRLFYDFEENQDFYALKALISSHPPRSNKWWKIIDLRMDRSMHRYANSLDEADQRNGTKSAEKFIASVSPRTELGRQLIEAFCAKIANRQKS